MNEGEAVAAAAAAAGLPEWVWIIGGILGTAALSLIAKLGNKAGSADKVTNTQAAGLVAMAPIAEKSTLDAIVMTLGEMDMKVERILALMEEEKRDREEEEKEELRELWRMKARLEGPRDPMRRDQT